MECKKGLIFIFLVICFLSIAGVCASDAGDANIQMGNDTLEDVVALDMEVQEDSDAIASHEVDANENDDVVASQEETGHDAVAVNDENDELGMGISFDYLYNKIAFANPGEDVVLIYDYSMMMGGETVPISKNITIDGDGHTLSGDNLHTIFNISADGLNITFKNIIFKNGGAKEFSYIDERGGAIFNPYSNTNLTIINCEFKHNGVVMYGGAIFSNGELTIIDSKFYKNIAETGNGGAIFCHSKMSIINSEFEGNEVQKIDNFIPYKLMLLAQLYYYDGEHHKVRPDYDSKVEEMVELYTKKSYYYDLYKKGKITMEEFEVKLRDLDGTSYGDDFEKSIVRDLEDIEKVIIKLKYYSDAPLSGGAIFCQGECFVNNSTFKNNIVGSDNEQVGTSGGAIHCKSNMTVHNSTFVGNSVNDWGGGAIFCEKKCTIYGSSFEDNTANKGCAVYCWDETKVYDSEFSYNHHIEDSTWLEQLDPVKKVFNEIVDLLCEDIPLLSTVINKVIDKLDLGTKVFFPSEGGAIWSGGKCLIDSCTFDNNIVMEHGGAIYASSDLNITGHDNVFQHNMVGRTDFGGFYKDGGAIYCCGNLYINNTGLFYNTAESDGGAIFCEKESNIYNSVFKNNVAVWKELFKLESCEGGAIKTMRLGEVNNCQFINNSAGEKHSSYKGLYAKAGAVYVKSACSPKFISCLFESNHAPFYGGAIYMESSDSNLILTSCEFNSNHVTIYGGAIYLCGKSTIMGSSFNHNYVSRFKGITSADDDNGCGGAIYVKKELTLDHSNFTDNKASYDKGGAVYSEYRIELKNCTFTMNHAKYGGAVYQAKDATFEIFDSTFENNSAESGGALYITDSVIYQLSHSKFIGNTASADGGAIYSKYGISMKNFLFEGNSATKRGGAIYCSDGTLKGEGMFVANTATQGGAIYTFRVEKFVNSAFLNNTAKGYEADGGAIYAVNSMGTADHISTFLTCRFEGNNADNRGGAIFFKKPGIYDNYIEASYCTFIDNNAKQKDYEPLSYIYRGAGHSIFTESKIRTLDKCWFGTNDPNFYGQFILGTGWTSSDENKEPTDVLKIAMKIDDNHFYEGSIYRTTVYFYSVKGNKLQSNIMHSDGKFWGDAEFYNEKLGNANEMYADVNFTLGTHSIYAQLDYQVLSLKDINVEKRYPSSVDISCEDIKYPDTLKVMYVIHHMTNATYVIRDSEGNNVTSGNLTSPDTLYVDGLRPGNYTITIDNLGSRSTLPSSKNATFSVYRGDLDLMIVVFNETYPDEVECIVHAGEDGKYRLDIDTITREIVVKNNICHYTIGTIDAGNYTATISFAGNDLYAPCSNSTTFTVSREGTSFEVEIVPDEIAYGGSAKVIPIFTEAVNGTVVYHLHNGTFLGELPAGENLTLPVLDVGHYVIIANYSGDRDHEPAFDSARIIINKALPVFKIEVDTVRYGENATVIAILPSAAAGTVRYYLSNGTFLGEAAVNENLTLPVLYAGSYLIIANYSGDSNFFNATANVTLTVNKAETGIIADPVIVMYNSNGDLLIILKDIYGNPIGGVNVTVDLNGVKNYTTDQYGQAFVSTNNIRVGTYNVSISFNGTSNYLNCSNTTNVTITKMRDTMVSAPLVTVYQVHKYLVINLKDELNKPVANENVIITINGVSYKCKTDAKGNARLIIRLDAKTYTAKVTFVNDNYASATKYVKVTVLKATPKIIAKKKTFKAKKKVKKYKVKLTVHGKALAKVKVTLKIKGKTYKAKTNSKGKAVFKIKKLTKKGKYKAKITYKGNYLYKKVTKKVKIRIK